MATAHFTIEDQQDGWWHCPECLTCDVIDGPRPVEGLSGEYYFVSVDPPISWHGDPGYAERWGDDHPLVRPMSKTDRAFVMVADTDAGVPVYPAESDGDSWKPITGLAAKVCVIWD